MVSAERPAASDDRCWVNNGGFALDGKTHMTGAQIRALPMPSIRDTDDLYMEVPGSEDLLVQYDEVVPVAGRRFFSVPSIINAGSPDAATDVEFEHYYGVSVMGYVVVKLPPDSDDRAIHDAALEAIESGELDMKHYTVDEEWDE